MNNRCLYLCGPIDGVTPEWATEWRNRVAKELPQYKVLDPCEGKDLHHPECNTTLYTPEEIVEADLAMIKQADVLLVDWRRVHVGHDEWWQGLAYREQPMKVGTIMEIKEAYELGKQVITFGNLKRGYWLKYHSDKHFDTLEQALEYLKGA